jgi:hypothetical protein
LQRSKAIINNHDEAVLLQPGGRDLIILNTDKQEIQVVERIERVQEMR